MHQSKRPLSPHLQIYRPQLTSVLSITHRASGIFLALAAVLLVIWLAALATGPEAFASAQAVLGSWPMLLLAFLVSGAAAYHFCNGIRHLFWDAGYGYELKTVYRSGWTVVMAAIGLTVVVWIVALTGGA